MFVLFPDTKGLMDIREQYECVSFSDYIYIMEHLESNEYRKTWIRCVTYCCHTLPGDKPSHVRLKITFFLDSQRLMALSPSAAHESLLKFLQKDLNAILDTIPIPSAIAYCQASPNITH